MKKRNDYPLSLPAIKSNINFARDVILKERPHKGAFIDVFIPEGSFMVDSPGELYDSLTIGQRLSVKADETSTLDMPPLLIYNSNGEFIGKIPNAIAILPNILLSRGISLWCHLEAKAFNGGMPEFAVSVYSELY